MHCQYPVISERCNQTAPMPYFHIGTGHAACSTMVKSRLRAARSPHEPSRGLAGRVPPPNARGRARSFGHRAARVSAGGGRLAL